MVGLEADGTGRYSTGKISGLNFDDSSTGGLVAVQAVAGSVLNSEFSTLVFNTSNGVLCTTYCQGNTFDHFQSQGPMNTLLSIYGNFNNANTIDKEGGTPTGTTVGCYIQIGAMSTATQSDDNYLQHILIEGATSANKSALCITNALQTVVDDMWWEGTGSATNLIALNTTNQTTFRDRIPYLTASTRIISLISSTNVSFDLVDVSSDTQSFYSKLSVDGTSTFTGPNILQTRYNTDSYPASFLAAGGGAKAAYSSNLLAIPKTGWSPLNQYKDSSSSNLISNGSFEAGLYGWNWNTSSNLTTTFPQSALGPGNMLQASWVGSGNYALYQNVTVPAAWVGQVVSFSAQVYITGTYTQAAPYMSGVGIDGPSASYSAITLTGQWETISVQFKPQSAGTLLIGVWFIGVQNGTVAYVDDATLSFGTIGQRYSNKFASLDLGKALVTDGSVQPNSGTWPVGSFVLNTGTSATGVFGWRCANSSGCSVTNDWLSVSTAGGSPTIAYSTPATAANTTVGQLKMIPTVPSGNHSYTIHWYVTLTAAGTSCTGTTTIALVFEFVDPNTSSQQNLSTTVTLATTGNGTVGYIAQGLWDIISKGGQYVAYQVPTYTAGSGCTVNPTFQLYPTVVQNW